MSYDPNSPPAKDMTSLVWALWVARTVSGDVSGTWTDSQWGSLLDLTATSRIIATVPTTYYRPFEAAARFVVTPEAITRRRVGGIEEEYVSPLELAKQLSDAQADLDEQIPQNDATEAKPLRCFLGTWE